MVKDQKTRENLDEIVDKIIGERIDQFKKSWNVEKEAEVAKLKVLCYFLAYPRSLQHCSTDTAEVILTWQRHLLVIVILPQ